MNYLSIYKQWLSSVNDLDKQELLSIEKDNNEIKERFSLPLEFGTAGMRGVIGIGTYRMNVYTVQRATKGLSDYVLSLGDDAMKSGVVIAYDTRRFSYEFALAAAKVLSYYKINCYLFEDVRPVPICSFAVRYLKATAGIMITASHNPKEYNGYKVYGDDGAQMSPEATAKVVEYINKVKDYFCIPSADVDVNSRKDIIGADNKYINEYVKVVGESIDREYFKALSKLSLSKEAIARQAKSIKIVYTPIHGAGYKPVMRVLEQMGLPINVVAEQAEPDINFSTVSAPNPENQDTLSLGIKLADELGSDVVIGTDPDGDRMGIALRGGDNQFYLLNGNQIGVLLLDYILRRKTETGTLPENAAVVKTIVTTSLANKVVSSYGAKIYDVLTGFKFIGEKIKQWESNNLHTFMFGYEESYGYLAGTHSRDKDAVVASMLFAEMVAYYMDLGITITERLQQIYEKHGYYTDKSVAITYKGLDGMARMAEIMCSLREITINEIAGYNVEFFSDYNKSLTIHKDGKSEEIYLPKSNVLYYGLSGGDWACVRPSGTEPKLKIYVSVSADSKIQADDKAQAIIDYMSKYL